MDDNLIHKVKLKYYEIIDFPGTSKGLKPTSLFYVNFRRLSAHLEYKYEYLKRLKSIQLSSLGVSFKNVNLDGYKIHS